jgi:uncharacterized OB-fold protein
MSASHAKRRQRPVAEGLFQFGDAPPSLLGTRCKGCATLYFPRSLGCRNPRCPQKQIEDASFGQAGTLYSHTVQAYRPPPLFQMDNWAPYPIGLIDLPEGLRVLAMITGCAPSELRIGMPMTLCTRVLFVDTRGCEVLTYAYRPSPEGHP